MSLIHIYRKAFQSMLSFYYLLKFEISKGERCAESIRVDEVCK